MSTVAGFTGAVGNTPLIRLKSVSDESGCEILGKAEFMNPGGSVKDRAASATIIAAAEADGTLRAGGTVVEGARRVIPASVWRTCVRHVATVASS